ncbi:AAA family ATPase [Parasedimentitalea marina]|uniref:AAA family ATPase n=1 Tax=Parasedimentitalea marina TaxID=2483033 RepID=A0A3T0MYV8_9RHOB|nr:AAA family ATPase [Parasedimentitalea marina]AZV76953.1 AAA family ATPase [Parasedimentitalea marina]
MAQRIPLLKELRLFRIDDSQIEDHLIEHLRTLRSTGLPDGDESYSRHRVFLDDRAKISRRADQLIKARSRFDQGGHLKRDERKLLKPIMEGVTLEGPKSVHEVDEIAAKLFEEMPWLQSVIHTLWLDMRHHIQQGGTGLKFRPTLLQSPPGLGKSHLIKRLSELCKLPTVQIDGGSGSEGFPLSGVGRGWGSAECGRPLKVMLSRAVANPIVCIDEIDKAGVAESTSGLSTSLHHALLGLLEPISAESWTCPFFQTTFDMSHINWIMSCNDASRLPEPLRTRVRTVYIVPPTDKQMTEFIKREVLKRGMSECVVRNVQQLMCCARQYQMGNSIRMAVRLIDELHRLDQVPLFH